MAELQEYKKALMAASEKIKTLHDRVLELEKDDGVAVIGMACRFPGGAVTPEKFWEMLVQGKDTTTEIPGERWDINDYFNPDPDVPGGIYTKHAHFIQDVDKFDCRFFNITPREAVYIDPQQRLLMEVSWEALENAGFDPQSLSGSRTGVYMGITGSDYEKLISALSPVEDLTVYSGTGMVNNSASGRLSYFYNFNGPSVVSDTACSSSLVSVAQAIRDLLDNSCDLALAGGVQLLLAPGPFVALSRSKAISPDGRCKAFAAGADGFGRGEGCGVIVLKRLSAAKRDGDRILSVIPGYAIGHDGKSNGFTAPNGLAQEQLIKQALRRGGLSIEDIGYVETHGTGTELGDPVEAAALGKVFKDRSQPLLIGAVKSNIGHLEAASGIAGVIKVILAQRHATLPGNLYFDSPNPHIPWDKLPLKVLDRRVDWPKKGNAAGVSSFGISGTIGHIILRMPDDSDIPEYEDPVPEINLLTISAKTETELEVLADRYLGFLERTESQVAGICYTSNISRSSFPCRISIPGKDIQDLKKKLRKKINLNRKQITSRKLCFLFTGQGSQAKQTGQGLYRHYSVFKNALGEVSLLFDQYIDTPVLSLIFDEAVSADTLRETQYAQPVIFSVQYALLKLWASWGIQPDAVMGHSIGALAGAYAAGILRLEDAVKIVAHRSALMQTAGPGGMLVLSCDKTRARALLATCSGDAVPEIAAVNSPSQVTLSGTKDALRIMEKAAEAVHIPGRMLNVGKAFHSRAMDDILQKFREKLKDIPFHKAKIEVINDRTGALAEDGELQDPEHWVRHLRDTIHFADGITVLEERGFDCFLEIGGAAVLSGLGEAASCNSASVFVPSLRKQQSDLRTMGEALGVLYERGFSPDWKAVHDNRKCEKADLPVYAFNRRECWLPALKNIKRGGQKNDSLKISTTVSAGIERSSLERILNGQLAVMQAQIQTLKQKKIGNSAGLKSGSGVAADIGAENGKGSICPMASVQKRMFALDSLEGIEETYHIPSAMIIRGELKAERVETCFQELIFRHESLRTIFDLENGEFVQRIVNVSDFKLQQDRISRADIDEYIIGFIRPFDLSEAPLMRVALAELDDGSYLLLTDFHHIIVDGYSSAVLTQEFIDLYQGKTLPPVIAQYRDYVEWEKEYLASSRFRQQADFWQKQLDEEFVPLKLFGDVPGLTKNDFNGKTFFFSVNPDLSLGLKKLAKSEGASLYMVLLTVFNIFLAKMANQETVSIGTAMTVREDDRFDDTIGMFTNTLLLCNRVEFGESFAETLKRTKKKCIEVFINQQYPFEYLVDQAGGAASPAGNPFFNIVFGYETAVDERMSAEGMVFESYHIPEKKAMFDVLLLAFEHPERIDFKLTYNSDLFMGSTVNRWQAALMFILESVIEQPERTINNIDIISDQEKDLLLNRFNDCRTEYPSDRSIVSLFEEQVHKTPEAQALVYAKGSLTYKELNGKINQVADYLLSRKIGTEEIVGLLVPRSPEMIIGILGILKAGGAYLPLDVKYPEERINYMIQDADVRLVLSLKDVKKKQELAAEVIYLDDRSLYSGKVDNPGVPAKGSQLAYIMYTSGSTGEPKGVMIEQRSVSRLVKNTNYIDFRGGRILLTGAPVFDATTFEIWGALLNGLPLCIIDDDSIVNAGELEKALKENQITILWLSAPLFDQLIRQNPHMFSGLDYLLVGGDVLTPQYINQVRGENKNLKVINGYGPTENTTFSTCYRIERDFSADIPIGRPIANSSAYILGPRQELLPLGAPGELYLGGDGLARGYYHQPELNKQKFISHPFIKGQRLYRSGDLARWLPEGNIQFLGRKDHQVKIRGFRVELDAIENCLARHPHIEDSLIVTIKENNKVTDLCAYIISKRKLTGGEIKNHLAHSLPAYMVPGVIVFLDEFPLNQNGKIDRSKLPAPTAVEGDKACRLPETEDQKKLAMIWRKVLNLPQVGLEDNFFACGGHSLKAVELVSLIKKEFDVDTNLSGIFEYSDFSAMLEYILSGSARKLDEIVKAPERREYPVTSQQRRLYFMQTMSPESIAYNIPAAFEVSGALELRRIEKVFKEILDVHASLRTAYKLDSDMVTQQIMAPDDFTIEFADDAERDAETLFAEFIKPFVMDRPPLLRLQIVKRSADSFFLFIDMHHIAADGLSVKILIQDFMRVYGGLPLEKPPLDYVDYAVWQDEYLGSKTYREDEAYWLEELKELPGLIKFPADFSRPQFQKFDGEQERFPLNPELVEDIRRYCLEKRITHFMFFFAVYTILLAKYAGRKDVVVGTSVAGRSYPGLEGIVGMFVNTVVLRSFVDAELSFSDYVVKVKNKVLRGFEHQHYPFEDLVEKAAPNRTAGENPLFSTMFNLQNFEFKDIEVSDFQIKQRQIGQKISKFDLTLNVEEKGREMFLQIEYSTNIFKSETICSLKDQYFSLLNQSLKSADLKIADMNSGSSEKKEAILARFNDDLWDE